MHITALIISTLAIVIGIVFVIHVLRHRNDNTPQSNRHGVAIGAVTILAGAIPGRQALWPDANWLHWVLLAAMLPGVVIVIASLRENLRESRRIRESLRATSETDS